MRTARQAGARGVIAKDRPARALLEAVRELAAGGACEPAPAAAGRGALRPARARDPAARRRRADQRRDRRVALSRPRDDQAPHARALRQARRAQPRRRRAHRAPPRRAGRPSGRRRSRAHRRVRSCACWWPTPTTSAAPACCSPCTAARRCRRPRRRRRVAPHGVAGHRAGRERAQPRARACARCSCATTRPARPPSCARRAPSASCASGGRERLADAVVRACRGPRERAVERAHGAGAPTAVSPREREVLTAFATGATNPAIAADLGLSPNTVKQHASRSSASSACATAPRPFAARTTRAAGR